ncbi:hypothetical protein LN650_23725 [Klebsiella pneumoniae subsp. pneumoniae]|nr:hypothetical protein [Klebsiella pneumoniae subsp. pneumoniae]
MAISNQRETVVGWYRETGETWSGLQPGRELTPLWKFTYCRIFAAYCVNKVIEPPDQRR